MSIGQETDTEKYSTWIHISFNISYFMTKATAGMLLATIFYFYETEIHLPVIYVGAATIIFFIWDAINDPFVGHISDKPNRMWKKWGRRFPWIMIGTIPTGLTFVLLYTPPGDPGVSPVPVFIWFVVFLVLHEFFYTMSGCNILALFPEKFLSQKERNKNNAIGQLLQRFANVVGTALPLVLIIDGDPSTYWVAALILVGIGTFMFLLSIPGIRESQEMRARAVRTEQSEAFFPAVKEAMKLKNFRTTTWVTILNTTFNACLISSVLYWANYVLELPEDSPGDMLLTVVWFLALLVAIPPWSFVISKVGTKKTVIVGLVTTALASLGILFVSELPGALACMAVLGVTMSACFLSVMLMFGDSVDEATLRYKRRREGIYAGVFTFYDRLGFVIQTIIFTVVHLIIQFDPNIPATGLVKGGLVASFTWIPALGLILAVFLVWKNYDLRPQKLEEIKSELKRMGL